MLAATKKAFWNNIKAIVIPPVEQRMYQRTHPGGMRLYYCNCLLMEQQPTDAQMQPE
jgi:hypothetical protein